MDAQKVAKLKELRLLIDSISSDAAVSEAEQTEPDAPKDAWKRLLALSSHTEFCAAKMAERLAREGFEVKDIREAVEKAVRIGLIDDIRWGEMRIAALMRKGQGIEGIERDLQGYGIEAASIPGWPEDYSARFGSELERACALLAAKPIRSKDPRASAYARLLRKGYSSAIASEAAKTL